MPPIKLLRTLAAVLATALLVVLSGSAAEALPQPMGAGTEDFDSAVLDSRWSWLREDSSHWSLSDRPGYLRITTQAGTFYQNVNNTKNVLLQAAPAGDFEIQTRVVFSPGENIQSAGLIVYQDDDNMLGLTHAFCDLGSPCAGNAVYFDLEEQGQLVGGNFPTELLDEDEAYLRLRREGDRYSAYYSANGTDWIAVGTHSTTSLLPAKAGLFAYNSTFGAAEIPADFDFFSLIALPYRVMLPLVVNPPPALPYRLVPDSWTCAPNAGVSYYNGVVRDRTGKLQNGVCVHIAFIEPRNTKCSGCDGVGNGNWGFAPFGANPAPPDLPVEIFIVSCPPDLPPGGQSSGFGDLTPLSEKWLLTTTAESLQCTGITFQEN